ncbi:hypothetical protein K502DRAFT_346633 [Neoconidiobolus thromboides FSU 785]|nr:hypothetical protein K502DRAFT_346633 [Neoconidiobolus thromboides FSU 785]
MKQIPDDVLYLYQNKVVTTFSHVVSIIFTLIVLTTVAVISSINQSINKSLPYRLSIFILIGDLFFSCFSLIAISVQTQAMCTFAFFMVIFSTLISLLYTLAIGLNLYLMVVHKYYIGRCFRYFLYIAPFLISLILTLIPLIMNKLVLIEGDNGGCWYNEAEDGIYWAYFTNYGWIIFSIVFCTFVFVSVLSNLVYNKYSFTSNFKDSNVKNEINKYIIIRLLMFPLIPIVCYFLLVLRLICMSKFGESFNLSDDFFEQTNIAMSFFKGFQGFLNGSLFLYNKVLYKEAERAISKATRKS